MRAVAIAVVLLSAVGACGGHNAKPGQERGACYSNGTCDMGLACFSHLCVRYDGGGSAAAGTGGIGDAAAGNGGGTGGVAGDSGGRGGAGVGGAAGAVGGRGGAGAGGGTAGSAGGAAGAGGGSGGGGGASGMAGADGSSDAASNDARDAGSTSCAGDASGAPETVVAFACGSTPATTTDTYGGFVGMIVSGQFENSPGVMPEDAFYYVDPNDSSVPVSACPDCFRYNRFAEGTCVCSYECAATSHRVADLLVGGYPAFRADHQYTVTLNLGAGPSDRLDFGMADCGCGDNSGTHTITLTHLTTATCAR
jgi:hypothetical protein